MEQQFNLPLTPDDKADNDRINEEMQAELTPDLATLTRAELEVLYKQKIGMARYLGRTDDELKTAIMNPEEEIARLREVDRTDAWEDINPSVNRSLS